MLGLTAPLPLFAQSSGGSSDSVATANEATSRDPAATDANVTRVPEASMRQHFTSKDLIGAEVYDANGEKIGDIADIGLESPEISELARAFQAGQVAEEGREAESGADTSDTTVVSPASATGAPEPRATDASSSGPRVFISVGGLWGIGDDLVSVPLSDLSYNAAEARFEIPVMKADVVALNEADAEGEGVETDTEEDSVVGKQAFTDDATRVETALRTDERTSAFAQNVSVMLEDGEIRLRGTVADEAQRQLLLAVARDATEMTIQDHLVIRR